MTRSPIFQFDSCDLEPREMMRPAPTNINIVILQVGNAAWKREMRTFVAQHPANINIVILQVGNAAWKREMRTLDRYHRTQRCLYDTPPWRSSLQGIHLRAADASRDRSTSRYAGPRRL
jgi:hypothetical protein